MLLEQVCDHLDALLELQRDRWHGHNLFGRDELVAHWDRVVEEREVLGVDGTNVEGLVEDASNREGDEEREDDRQEQVHVLGGLEHDNGEGE